MKYIDLATAKKILPNLADDVIQEIVTDAEILMEASLGRSLTYESYTRRVDGNGSNILLLEISPASVESVRMGGASVGVEGIDGLSVMLTRSVPKGRKNVSIEFNAGYKEIPEDFKIFFKKFLSEIVRRDAEISIIPPGVKSQKIGDLSVVYLSPDELLSAGMGASLETPAMRAVFEKYKVFPLFAS